MKPYNRIWPFLLIIFCWIFSISLHQYFFLNAAIIIAAICSIFIIGLDIRTARPDTFGYDPGLNDFAGRISSWILFAMISLTQIAYVNEHVYGLHPTTTSLYDGVFTHGGYMPVSDNAAYLIGIQSFLRYGMTVSLSVFRPSGVYWSALLYKLSGESMIIYFYLQAFLSSVGIWALAISLRRIYSWPWVLLCCFFLSRYIGLFQGSFLTELAAMPFALMSLSMIIFGWSEKRKYISLIGLSLLAVAFEIRPAVFILPPLLFLLMGWSPQRYVFFSWKNVFIAMMVYVITVIGIRSTIELLDFPPPTISNTYGKLYQIYKGSEAWDEANNIIVGSELKDPMRKHQYRQEYIQRLIIEDPTPLIRNYCSILNRTISEPQKLFEVIDPMMSKNCSIMLLILLLFGFVIYQGKPAMILLHATVVFFFLAAIFSRPFLHAEFRVMSVTQPFVVIMFVMALNNLWQLIRHLFLNILPFHVTNIALITLLSNIETADNNQYSSKLKSIMAISFLILVLAVVAPICLDKARSDPQKNLFSIEDATNPFPDTSLHLFLLDLKRTPRMHFIPGEIKVSTSPAMMSLGRIKDRWLLDSVLRYGFHLFNALNHINYPQNRISATQLVIPDHMLSGMNLDQTESLLLEIRKEKVLNGPYSFMCFRAQRILSK